MILTNETFQLILHRYNPFQKTKSKVDNYQLVTPPTTLYPASDGKLDCDEWAKAGATKNGTYLVTIGGSGGSSYVYCEFDTLGDGKSWIVIQR